MDVHDYTAEHFKLMTDLALWLPDICAQLKEHTYSYKFFGSWWFTFAKAGRMYRVIYDGKENELRLELGSLAPDSQWVAIWEQIESVHFQEFLDGDDLQRAARSLVERHT
jgi:hypothetical protein